jgi:hypothetical protein
MGYEFLLKDFDTKVLEKELERRKKAAEQNICDFCERWQGTYPPCRHIERHIKLENNLYAD